MHKIRLEAITGHVWTMTQEALTEISIPMMQNISASINMSRYFGNFTLLNPALKCRGTRNKT